MAERSRQEGQSGRRCGRTHKTAEHKEKMAESQNSLSLKGTTRIIRSNSWPSTGHTNNPTLRALSRHFLRSVRFDAPHFPGEPVPCPTTLWVKNLSRISNLNLPRESFLPVPRVLCQQSHLSAAPNFPSPSGAPWQQLNH